MLKGKKIVLGITGSIAAYKSATLARLLIKQGAEVQVVITPAGKEFITPITLSALTSKPVVSDFFSGRDGTWNSHVDLGIWADAMLIAPASAASIGKMAHGIADNMLITTYLSMKAPIFVAPAMDLDMYAHASTHDNLRLLRDRGNHIIEPANGFLASHLVGKGRMQEPEDIVAYLADYFAQTEELKGKRVLITAGPTHEAIDSVRFLGNHSTGRMGIALANECVQRGAQVDLILGPSSLSPDPLVQTTRVTSALQMLSEAQTRINDADIAIFAAAVADYRPKYPIEGKLKREKADNMVIELEQNPDIAASLGMQKRPDQYFIGFALEAETGEEEAKRKMRTKHFDAIVLNSLQDSGAGFGYETNKVHLFANTGQEQVLPLKSKTEIARDIINFVLAQFNT